MPAITPLAWDTGFEVAEGHIANLALDRIGADHLKATEDDTPISRIARATFMTTRDELLRNYDFNFAKIFLSLSEDTAITLLGEWEHAYSLPATPIILKVLKINDNPENLFAVMGAGNARHLYCNMVTTAGTPNKLNIQAVQQVIDPDQWDNLFRDAFVLRLASKLAVPIAKSAQLAQLLQSEFTAIYNMAANSSSQETQVDPSTDLWTNQMQSSSSKATK